MSGKGQKAWLQNSHSLCSWETSQLSFRFCMYFALICSIITKKLGLGRAGPTLRAIPGPERREGVTGPRANLLPLTEPGGLLLHSSLRRRPPPSPPLLLGTTSCLPQVERSPPLAQSPLHACCAHSCCGCSEHACLRGLVCILMFHLHLDKAQDQVGKPSTAAQVLPH